MRTTRHSLARRALLATAFSTCVALVFMLSRMAAPGHGAEWPTALLASLAEWWSWALVALAVPTIDRHLPFADARSGRPLLLHVVSHLGAGLLVTAIYVVLYAALEAAFGVADWSRIVDGRLAAEAAQGMYVWEFIVYALLAGAWLAWRFHRRSIRAELALSRLERDYANARLEALRLQLDPHFLFNALNTISAEVQTEPRRARQMIEHLGELLRQSLEPDHRQEVTLSEEIALLEHYLAIQRARFSDRLSVTLDIEPAARDALVPSMLLQPLLENAIRHGLAPRPAGGRIVLRAARSAGRLLISVEDDGAGLPSGWSLDDCAGLGLALTRERVEALAPDDGGGQLSVHRAAAGGTRVEMSLPLRTTREAHDRAIA